MILAPKREEGGGQRASQLACQAFPPSIPRSYCEGDFPAEEKEEGKRKGKKKEACAFAGCATRTTYARRLVQGGFGY